MVYQCVCEREGEYVCVGGGGGGEGGKHAYVCVTSKLTTTTTNNPKKKGKEKNILRVSSGTGPRERQGNEENDNAKTECSSARQTAGDLERKR